VFGVEGPGSTRLCANVSGLFRVSRLVLRVRVWGLGFGVQGVVKSQAGVVNYTSTSLRPLPRSAS